MDDRYAYMLNNLWTRHYDLGRVIRFRHTSRGRQAESFEILTAEQREFAAYLFPPVFDPAQLAQFARAMGPLSQQRFPVALMVPARTGQWSVGGPQGTLMMAGENPIGQNLPADQWTAQDISLLGLRLAWMHRLLMEQLPPPQKPIPPSLHVQFETLLQSAASPPLPQLDRAHLARLSESLRQIPATAGWVHGDLQPAAVLLDQDRQIRTLVDWALLHPGEPMEDMVDVFVHWCVMPDGQVHADLGRVLLEAYRSLRTEAPVSWPHTVELWCARRIMDASAGRRPLPRGFATYLADSASLAKPLQFCDARAA